MNLHKILEEMQSIRKHLRQSEAILQNNSEQNHYYPFGLKHTYNLPWLKIEYDPTLSSKKIKPSIVKNFYKYKYQGQERQDELSLNWDSFKWRNYDYAIGRFMSVDPLAEKYAYNSTYAFQENKMGMGRELEGLELWVQRGTDGAHSTPIYWANAEIGFKNDNTGAKPITANPSAGINIDTNGTINYTTNGVNTSLRTDGTYALNGNEYTATDSTPQYDRKYDKMMTFMLGGGAVVGGVATVFAAPTLIAGGTTEALIGKATVSTIGQVAVNKDLDLADMTADTFLIPGASGLLGGAVNMKASEGFKLNINTDSNTILFNGGTSLVSGLLGARIAPALETIENTTVRTATEVMINTPYNTVEQALNKKYDEE